MDDEFGPDIDFSAAVAAIPITTPRNVPTKNPATNTTPHSAPRPKVQQPTPQALPSRSAPAAILVSPRQKGNPILGAIRALPWEYGDIPADYVLGQTTCALFLSLKYHRLHPEYIYGRVRALGGKYRLRVLLTMVDIGNHEEALRELAKTSLVNNLTLVLCWSASEAAHYLELYKSYEHASPASIRAHQATSYSEKLIEFITVPRSINKTDAVGLVSAFGSVKAAVNARPEEIAGIAGWGEKKVQRWYGTVREPFRVRKAAKRGIEGSRLGLRMEESQEGLQRGGSSADAQQERSLAGSGRQPSLELDIDEDDILVDAEFKTPEQTPIQSPNLPTETILQEPPGVNEALIPAATNPAPNTRERTTSDVPSQPPRPSGQAGGMNEGMAAALAKLRRE